MLFLKQLLFSAPPQHKNYPKMKCRRSLLAEEMKNEKKREECKLQYSKNRTFCLFSRQRSSVRHLLALLLRLHRASFQMETAENKVFWKIVSAVKFTITDESFFVFHVFETTAAILFLFLPVCLFSACGRACTVHRGCHFISHVSSANVFLGVFPHVKGLLLRLFASCFSCGLSLWCLFVAFCVMTSVVPVVQKNGSFAFCGLLAKLRSKSLSAKETCLFTASRKLESAIPSGE